MERDFKGVWIPKEVYLDTRLTALEKIILVEIDSLDGEGGCFASNEYLAEFCQCTQVKVSTAISKLIELGYLEKIGFDGRRRILKSRLKLSLRQTSKKFKAEINKVNSNNIDNKKDNKINIPPTLEEVREYCKSRNNGIDAEAFIDYYAQQGWKLANGNKMKDWQASVRTWEKRNRKNQPTQKRYKEFEPEPEIDAVPMPDDVRKNYNNFINSFGKEL